MLRRGEVSADDALLRAFDLDAQLEQMAGTGPLPERPDRDTLDRWLHAAYLERSPA